MEQTIDVDQVIADAVSPVVYGSYTSYAWGTIAPYYQAMDQAFQDIWENKYVFQPLHVKQEGGRPSPTAGPGAELLADRLKALGSTPLEVRDALVKVGIKAVPGSNRDCAIADWLKQRYPEAHISVGTAVILVFEKGSSTPIQISTPAPLRVFIGMFDQGQFPELEKAQNPVLAQIMKEDVLSAAFSKPVPFTVSLLSGTD